jgi:hypothetical protein
LKHSTVHAGRLLCYSFESRYCPRLGSLLPRVLSSLLILVNLSLLNLFSSILSSSIHSRTTTDSHSLYTPLGRRQRSTTSAEPTSKIRYRSIRCQSVGIQQCIVFNLLHTTSRDQLGVLALKPSSQKDNLIENQSVQHFSQQTWHQVWHTNV